MRQRAEAAGELRRTPDETIADFHALGFFKAVQPKRYGGYEMNPKILYQLQVELGKGCASSAWVYGVLSVHTWQLALFPLETQEEIWGGGRHPWIASSYMPVGTVVAVEGGYRISGRWSFSSGCDHSEWIMLGSFAPVAEGAPPDMRTFLLPRSDYTIGMDAWHTFGLQGTGSHDIIVNDVFVPEYRTHRAVDGFLCQNPGQAENTGPLYTLPWAQVFVRSVSTAAFGGAKAALDAAKGIMASRVSTNTGKASKADPFLQSAMARAHAQIIEMETMQRVTFDDLMGYATRGEPIPMEKRALYAYNSSNVVRRLAELIDDVVQQLGGRAIYMTSEIIQPWLDLNAGRAHVANDPGNRYGDVVGSMFGEAPTFTFL